MPWWSWLWVVLMALLTLTGAWFDLRDREPAGRTGVGVLTGLGCILLVLSHHELVPLPEPLAVSIVVGIGLVYEAWRDSHTPGRSEMPSTERALAIGAGLVLFLPAVGLGLLDAWNAR
jgi:hypothetical protein